MVEETLARDAPPPRTGEARSVDDTLIATADAARAEARRPLSVDDTVTAESIERSAPSVEETMAADPQAVSVVDDTMISADPARAQKMDGRSAGSGRKRGEIPAEIDRYVILGRLGSGAMGEVLAAYDPRLDRKVALKRIHPGGGSLDAARLRLEREAQALAKLDHRNVVAVHDVLVHDGTVLVAMEYVEGVTLGDWMKAGEDGRPRPWREVVPVFEAFGAGLAAVHAVGLIHRDVKPGNVMIGADARVRVMDFGLARIDDGGDDAETSAVHEIPEELVDLRNSILNSQAKTLELTQAGAMLGTPAYMAPEQFSGVQATARSDQFGFCVALHEALYGVRPFRGETVLDLCAAVIGGELQDPPRDVPVPAWLRAVVLRGLAHAPQDRYASMDELLAALGSYEQRRRRRRYARAGLGLGLLGLAALGVQRWDLATREQACVAAGAAVDEIWGPQARSALEAGIAATELSYAATTIERVLPRLDAYADSWRGQAQAACTAATIEQRFDDDTHDRARWCLEQRRSAMASLIDRLAHADGLDAQHAVESVAGLDDPSTCIDPRALAGMGAPPEPDLRPRVLELHDRLARTERFASGEAAADSAIELARAAGADARALPWLPLAIRAQRFEARLLGLTGKTKQAQTIATAAYGEAARAGLWTEATSAATALAELVGASELRGSEAKLWLENAEVARAHASDPLGLLASELEAAHMAVDNAAKDFDDAIAHGERAREGVEQVFGAQHPRVAEALRQLAQVHLAKGDYQSALDLQTQALDLARASLGANHPQVGNTLLGLGKIHLRQGERETAAKLFREAMAIFELDDLSRPQMILALNLLGIMRYDQDRFDEALAILTRASELVEQTPDLSRRIEADTIHNLGLAYRGLEEYAKARELYERALAIFVEILGPDSAAVAAAHNNVAILLYYEGDKQGAADRLELSIEIEEHIYGPNHPNLVSKLVNLGRTRAALGDHERSLADLRRALAINEFALGRDKPDSASLHRHIAGVSIDAGDWSTALRSYARGLSLLENAEAGAGWEKELARMQHAYGRALWDAPRELGRDRARARALVEQALAGFRAIDAAKEIESCQTWLAEHR